jgi:hypothetical protein
VGGIEKEQRERGRERARERERGRENKMYRVKEIETVRMREIGIQRNINIYI